MALFDLPAVIDYILHVKQESSLYYVGYSWGNTIFYMGMSLRPEYNSKIRLMVSLGPSALQHNFPNGLDFAAPIVQAASVKSKEYPCVGLAYFTLNYLNLYNRMSLFRLLVTE
jgi:hypothetical protein